MTVRRFIRRPFLAGDCFDIGRVEAYAFGRALGPRESLLAAVADRDHGSRPVGRSTQLPEDVTGPPVEPDVDDALERPRLVLTVDLAQFAGWSGQEADASAPHHLRGQERPLRDLFAERGRKREGVQVDAEGGAGKLSVVATAEPRAELTDTWPVRPDPQPRVGRTVQHSECGCGRRS